MLKRPQVWIKKPHAFLILLVLAATMALELGLTLGAEVLASSPLPTPQAPCTASSTSNSYNCTRDEGLEKEWNEYTDSLKPVKFTASGYTSHVNQTDSEPCISATGDDICKLYKQGMNIAASNDLPLRSTFEWNGKTWHVLDRMNRRYTGTQTIDIYFGNDLDGAVKFGRKTIQIVK